MPEFALTITSSKLAILTRRSRGFHRAGKKRLISFVRSELNPELAGGRLRIYGMRVLLGLEALFPKVRGRLRMDAVRRYRHQIRIERMRLDMATELQPAE